MQVKQPLSIVIPTLNEVDNVPAMLARIDASLTPAHIPYEVVIVDDHSSDGTVELAQTLTTKYPLSIYSKRGKRGKAYSLLEGFDLAKHELIVMIDADLQYPPEEIAPMYQLMADTNADVVVTNRQEKNVSALRKLSTKIFNLIFARLLFGISYDTQSGLKLFKKRILRSFTMTPSPWSFDLEFLVRSLENHYTIVSHDIQFAERNFGATKVRLIQVTFELAKASLELRWRTSTSRLRAGSRANNRFLEKAFQIIAVASLLTFGSLSLQPSTTEANSFAAAPRTTASLVDSVLQNLPLVGNKQSSGSSPSQQRGATPSQQSTNPVQKTTAENSAQQAAAQSASATATAATPSSSSARATSAAPVDQSKLTASTGRSSGNAYADTYPTYKLSASATNRVLGGGQLAIVAGVLCLIAVIITSGIRVSFKFGSSLFAQR